MKIFKSKIVMVLLAAIALYSFGMGSKPFPEMQVKSLEGKTMHLPQDAKGKFALVCIATSLKAQDDLYTWYEPVMSQLTGIYYPVNLYFVPMTARIKGISQDKIEEKLKSSIQREFYKNVLVYQEDPSPFEASLSMKDKNTPYIFVVDPEGNIIYNTSGAYTEAKMDKITDAIAE